MALPALTALEKLRKVFILLIAVLSVGLVFVLLIRRPFTKIEVFFLSVWAGGMLLSVLMELFSWGSNQKWMVLTTRGQIHQQLPSSSISKLGWANR